MSLRQGQVGLGHRYHMYGMGPKLCALLLSGFIDFPLILSGPLKYVSFGLRSKVGLKRYVLEAGPSGAGDTGTICMGGA